jgi:hypothetical protein
MERLGHLYHWSPLSRRDEILEHGLVPGSEPNIASVKTNYICMSPTPYRAWEYSGNISWAEEIHEWDLWMVTLDDHDEIHFRSEWGPWLVEIRCSNVIPPDRLWWVALRER